MALKAILASVVMVGATLSVNSAALADPVDEYAQVIETIGRAASGTKKCEEKLRRMIDELADRRPNVVVLANDARNHREELYGQRLEAAEKRLDEATDTFRGYNAGCPEGEEVLDALLSSLSDGSLPVARSEISPATSVYVSTLEELRTAASITRDDCEAAEHHAMEIVSRRRDELMRAAEQIQSQRRKGRFGAGDEQLLADAVSDLSIVAPKCFLRVVGVFDELASVEASD